MPQMAGAGTPLALQSPLVDSTLPSAEHAAQSWSLPLCSELVPLASLVLCRRSGATSGAVLASCCCVTSATRCRNLLLLEAPPCAAAAGRPQASHASCCQGCGCGGCTCCNRAAPPLTCCRPSPCCSVTAAAQALRVAEPGRLGSSADVPSGRTGACAARCSGAAAPAAARR